MVFYSLLLSTNLLSSMHLIPKALLHDEKWRKCCVDWGFGTARVLSERTREVSVCVDLVHQTSLSRGEVEKCIE
jgi:hypothetical protein